MNYSSPAQDCTGKQLQDKQFAEFEDTSKLGGEGPFQCNTAYLVNVRCFIDANVLASLTLGGTSLMKSFLCLILPL